MQGFVARACGVLTRGHAEVAKLTVEMLIKLCLFSSHSYQLAIQVRAAMLVENALQNRRSCCGGALYIAPC